MKKVVSIILAALMVSALSVSAFAAQREGNEEGKTVGTYTIFGDNERQDVENTTLAPYRSICRFIITYKDGSIAYGSGFMISDTRIATAAHCLYDQKKGTPTSIQVVPGSNGALQPFGYRNLTANNSTFVPHPNWKSAGNWKYDYGYIQMDKPFANASKIGYLSMKVYSDEQLLGLKNVQVSGYDCRSPKQLYSEGKLSNVRTYDLQYKLDTYDGQSGCPVMDSKNNVIGINNYGADSGDTLPEDSTEFNSAAKMTSSVRSFLLGN